MVLVTHRFGTSLYLIFIHLVQFLPWVFFIAAACTIIEREWPHIYTRGAEVVPDALAKLLCHKKTKIGWVAVIIEPTVLIIGIELLFNQLSVIDCLVSTSVVPSDTAAINVGFLFLVIIVTVIESRKRIRGSYGYFLAFYSLAHGPLLFPDFFTFITSLSDNSLLFMASQV